MKKEGRVVWFKVPKEAIEVCSGLCEEGELKACSISGRYFAATNSRQEAEGYLAKACKGGESCFNYSRLYLRFKEYPFYEFVEKSELLLYQKAIATNHSLCAADVPESCELLGKLILAGTKAQKLELKFTP